LAVQPRGQKGCAGEEVAIIGLAPKIPREFVNDSF